MNVIRIIPFTIIALFCFSCAKVDKKFYCSYKSNNIRKKFHIPIIEGDMKVDESAVLSDCRWQSSIKYPVDTNVLHAWKTISIGYKTITIENDAFRKKIDDTLFYQLNINSKLKNDSTLSVSGMVFYGLTNESKSLSLGFDKKYKNLDSLRVDSVKKSWELNY